MRLVVSMVMAACVLGNRCAAQEDDFESPDAYELVTPVAVSVLPAPLDAFFAERLTDLVKAATGARYGASPATRSQHLTEAVLSEDELSPETAESDVFEFELLDGTDRGRLPSHLLERYQAIVKAFQQGDPKGVVDTAGAMIHFATDVALPFHFAAFEGYTFHPPAPTDDQRRCADTLRPHRTLHQQFEIQHIRRCRDAWKDELRVSPTRFRGITDPKSAMVDTLKRSFEVRLALVRASHQLIRSHPTLDPVRYAAGIDEYYERLGPFAGPLMRARLEDGAILSAQLIHAAWVEAGKPDFPRSTRKAADPAGPRRDAPASAQPVNTAPSPNAGERTAAFLGSRNSETYHRSDCKHVDRIKPENLVRFGTAAEAQKAGRKPCKACQPDQPKP